MKADKSTNTWVCMHVYMVADVLGICMCVHIDINM